MRLGASATHKLKSVPGTINDILKFNDAQEHVHHFEHLKELSAI